MHGSSRLSFRVCVLSCITFFARFRRMMRQHALQFPGPAELHSSIVADNAWHLVRTVLATKQVSQVLQGHHEP